MSSHDKLKVTKLMITIWHNYMILICRTTIHYYSWAFWMTWRYMFWLLTPNKTKWVYFCYHHLFDNIKINVCLADRFFNDEQSLKFSCMFQFHHQNVQIVSLWLSSCIHSLFAIITGRFVTGVLWYFVVWSRSLVRFNRINQYVINAVREFHQPIHRCVMTRDKTWFSGCIVQDWRCRVFPHFSSYCGPSSFSEVYSSVPFDKKAYCLVDLFNYVLDNANVASIDIEQQAISVMHILNVSCKLLAVTL